MSHDPQMPNPASGGPGSVRFSWQAIAQNPYLIRLAIATDCVPLSTGAFDRARGFLPSFWGGEQ